MFSAGYELLGCKWRLLHAFIYHVIRLIRGNSRLVELFQNFREKKIKTDIMQYYDWFILLLFIKLEDKQKKKI